MLMVVTWTRRGIDAVCECSHRIAWQMLVDGSTAHDTKSLIPMTMFMLLSSWLKVTVRVHHLVNADWAPDGCQLSKPGKPILAVTPPVGCCHPLPQSPFITTTLILISPSHGGCKAESRYFSKAHSSRSGRRGTRGEVRSSVLSRTPQSRGALPLD